jgi:methanogenic corrinoid protein MtbC1
VQLRAVRDRIVRGDRAGAAIAAVRELHLDAPSPLGDAVDTFVAAANAIDIPAIDGLLREHEAAIGIRAVTELALPAMRAIGSRWRAGELDVAAEHAATSAVRRWFSHLQQGAPPATRPLVVLACAPGEHHTLGLEAFASLLAFRGFATRPLGADTPDAAVLSATHTTGARAVVVAAHRATARRAAVRTLEAVEALRDVRVLYAGNAFATARARDGVPGRYLGDDLVEATAIVEAAIG